jgi:hypothetical protein
MRRSNPRFFANRELLQSLDSVVLRCYLTGQHEIHEAQEDFYKFGKTTFVSWEKGKPRIIETSMMPAGEGKSTNA